MFALEIDFHDGVSSPEILLVRRPHVIVGTGENAHVVIEGAASSLVELRVLRGLGREFRCHPIAKGGVSPSRVPFLEGVYNGDASISLGDVKVHITALDNDLRLLSDESPDLAGLRIVRKALTQKSPLFPAVAVLGSTPLFVSFSEDEPLIVGRSRKCALRLEASDISSEHARIGFENNQLWIEDFGSTNGTFIGDRRVTGRQIFSVGEVARVGSEYRLAAVLNSQDIASLKVYRDEFPESSVLREVFPRIISNSELIRPASFAIPERAVVSIGRDPTNDIWVGSPHISRRHLEISINDFGVVEVCDLSSNGTFINGEMLPKGSKIELPKERTIIDLNEGVYLTLCYSKQDCDFQDDGGRQISQKIAEFNDKADPSADILASYPSRRVKGSGDYVQTSGSSVEDLGDSGLNDLVNPVVSDYGHVQQQEASGDESKLHNAFQEESGSVFDRLLKQQSLVGNRVADSGDLVNEDNELADFSSNTMKHRVRGAGGAKWQQTAKQLPLIFLIVALAAFCIWAFWGEQLSCMFGEC